MNRLQSIQLLGFRDNIHIAHWQAPRKTNEHKVLGNLYESILDKIDLLTELAISKDGELEFPEATIGIVNRCPYLDLLKGGLVLLSEIRATLTVGVDDDLLNVIAEISAEIRRAAYKLEVVLA